MKEFHFFASSVADWIVTNDRRELPDIIEFMEKEGYAYTLWMVPGDWKTNYMIEHYAPQVEGAQLLGHFAPKNVRKKKYKEMENKIDEQVWGAV
jgi:hypothetical protein